MWHAVGRQFINVLYYFVCNSRSRNLEDTFGEPSNINTQEERYSMCEPDMKRIVVTTVYLLGLYIEKVGYGEGGKLRHFKLCWWGCGCIVNH